VIEIEHAYENARSGGTLTILRHWDDTNGDVLELERALPLNTGKLPPHVHLDFVQTFTVVEGTTRAALLGDELSLGPGETLEAPRGAAHVDPWNAGPERAIVRNRVSPVPRFIEVYVETMVHRLLEGKLNGQDEFPFLEVAVLIRETDGQTFDSRLPIGLQRAILPLLAALGRLRGYRVMEVERTSASA
jgi:mannose-6-phosphate isomerase-like protein (cupin superfamily)